MRGTVNKIAWIGAAMLLVAGCRGTTSTEPPIHLNPNMDQQHRYDPQEPNAFFADNRAMRPPVDGTVAVGALQEDDHFYRGRVDGKLVETLPPELTLDKALLDRGHERFNIYCAPCHDQAGNGQGIVVKRNAGLTPPPAFHTDRLRTAPLGYFFEVMTNGVRTMPTYRYQIAAKDRWAIAAYVRALQLSRVAGLDQIPGDVAASKGWGAK
jgi:mono/diheme cytochrome c family protein